MTAVQNDEVRVELTVEAPIETAFRVFTDGFDTWWPRGHHIGSGELVEAGIEPRVGGRCYGREADGTTCPWGTVLVWEPPKRLAFSWDISLEWKAEPDPAKSSRVEVTFAATGAEQTAVTLVHSGFDRHGTGWESMRDGVSGEGGWPELVTTYAKAAASAA